MTEVVLNSEKLTKVENFFFLLWIKLIFLTPLADICSCFDHKLASFFYICLIKQESQFIMIFSEDKKTSSDTDTRDNHVQSWWEKHTCLWSSSSSSSLLRNWSVCEQKQIKRSDSAFSVNTRDFWAEMINAKRTLEKWSFHQIIFVICDVLVSLRYCFY